MADQGNVKKNGGIGKFFLIFFVIIIVLIIGFIALLKFDVAGLGTEVIGPKLVGVPGASLILPEMPEEEVAEGEDTTVKYETLEQAVEIIKVTENLLKEKEEEAETLSEQITKLEQENARLKVFEDNYLQFESDKDAFDAFIASNSDSKDYSVWYETMNPDNAAKLYSELKSEEIEEAEIKILADTYNEMKAENAAAVLSEMSTTRIEMVATIIKHLDADQRAKIVGAMETGLASRITTYLYPEETN